MATRSFMSRAFFDALEDALVGFLPQELRAFSAQRSSRNLKLWYGDDGREHYEAQLISASVLRAARIHGRGDALEIGFHAEHRDGARNEEVVTRLLAHEREWRNKLGRDAVCGRFVGYQSDSWRRISELWEGGALAEEATAVDAADRLAEYVRVLEPLRRRR